GETRANLVHRVEIVRLVAQMDAMIDLQRVPQTVEAVEESAHCLDAAQARLPRTGDAVKGRSDPGSGQLRVRVDQRDVDRHPYAGPRHELAFEGVTVKVHDAGQNERAGDVRLHALS